jgi:hypothetical protein
MKHAAAIVALLLVTASSAALAQSDAVTLSLSQYRDVNGVRTLVFSGTIASGAAGQTVELLGRDCGAEGLRLLGGAQTRDGGRWQLENPEHDAPYRTFRWSSGIAFRARWKEQLSDPVVLRREARPPSELRTGPIQQRGGVPGRGSWAPAPCVPSACERPAVLPPRCDRLLALVSP